MGSASSIHRGFALAILAAIPAVWRSLTSTTERVRVNTISSADMAVWETEYLVTESLVIVEGYYQLTLYSRL